jgi:hypothetical protein
VHPGDVIRGDSSGVVVVPREHLDVVIASTREVAQRDGVAAGPRRRRERGRSYRGGSARRGTTEGNGGPSSLRRPRQRGLSLSLELSGPDRRAKLGVLSSIIACGRQANQS